MRRVPTTSRFTPDDGDAARAALHGLYDLRECVIERVTWAEPTMELVVDLTYIWTDAGQICFSVGEEPRRVRVRFSGVDELHIVNALTTAMTTSLDRLNWGISEIAALELHELPGQRFAEARFVWEGQRRIRVIYSEIEISVM